jgi:hypothetical protein
VVHTKNIISFSVLLMIYFGLLYMRLSRFYDPIHRFDVLTHVDSGQFFSLYNNPKF